MQEELADAQCAVGAGYPESKWVCENILNAASFVEPALKTTVVRVAQMCGMSGIGGIPGCWNTKEWVPALFKASVQLGVCRLSIMCVLITVYAWCYELNLRYLLYRY